MIYSYFKPLRLKTNCGYEFYDFDEIIRFEANKNNTKLFSTNNENTSRVLMSLKEVHNLIQKEGFYRCHRSHIVNIRHIVAFYCLTNQIKLSDGSVIPVSDNSKVFFKRVCSLLTN